ncbi:hypothetical protein Y1Q_0020599 [Alligator mississippiensis]|uniref:Uncharacterized protein n=1 Tax=Alligator mississippiensis TaxID=8496 RepID=A0A151P643_ALLMI|nr:hypothetical protein Y1Q_0020599 [Alligator mississippiensis]
MSVLDTWAWAAACSGPSSLCCHSRAPWPGDIAVTDGSSQRAPSHGSSSWIKELGWAWVLCVSLVPQEP